MVAAKGFGRGVPALGEGWRDLENLREAVASECSAAYEAFTTPGADATRKWLGWALYRLAARVNPEIRD